MNYQEVLDNARPLVGEVCKACPVCNGRACGNRIPGPGAKGVGDAAIRNFDKWREIRLNMDTLVENGPVDMTLELFGKRLKYPIIAGPVGALKFHYGQKYDDLQYNAILIDACEKAGIVAMTGDGINEDIVKGAVAAIKKAKGMGIPTIKPWSVELVEAKMKLARESEAFAIAMDIDGAGLPFLKNMQPPAGSKSVEDLKKIVKAAGVPFIVKGIMTVKGALKAKEAGAAAIVVSNHGGRVLDQCAATAEVLPEIAAAVGDSMVVLVDGGIRSGADIFKALALGADGVVIARPFVTALYGGEAEGIKCYADKLGAELEDAMTMCGAHSLKEITKDMVRMG